MDCSQGMCSMYCPQWCHGVSPPPPDHHSTLSNVLSLTFVSVFLFVTIVSYCCERRTVTDEPESDQSEEGDSGGLDVGDSGGLDEAFIKSIRVCKYKKSDGLVQLADCAVCLSEFEEEESLRVLPACNHAFHLPCIDVWLKTKVTCPLCRSNIASFDPMLRRPVLPCDSSRNPDEQRPEHTVLEVREGPAQLELVQRPLARM